MSLLEVDHLSVAYEGKTSVVRAVRDISLHLGENEFLGLVGESGCGKSTLGAAIARILRPPGRVVEGRVLLDGADLWQMNKSQLKAVRWSKFSIVMQSGMNALNPLLTIKTHFAETFRAHGRMSTRQIETRTADLLDMVGIDPGFVNSYPHELSGGMKQRVCIALALALEPRLVIMDEPTTGLDVVVQRSIIQNLKELRRKKSFAVLFISHDLGTVLEMADKVAVMYAGQLVELQRAQRLLHSPTHPYTKALLECFPNPDQPTVRMSGIPGSPPNLAREIAGCPFAPRCKSADDVCKTREPERLVSDVGEVLCHHVSTMESEVMHHA
jgi:oligopeptide/dipeptide ABC transporter ATP-binding protein